MFGYPAAEAIGRQGELIIPADRLPEEQDVLRRTGQGEFVEHYETVRRHQNGSLLEVSVTSAPIRDRDGAVIGVT